MDCTGGRACKFLKWPNRTLSAPWGLSVARRLWHLRRHSKLHLQCDPELSTIFPDLNVSILPLAKKEREVCELCEISDYSPRIITAAAASNSYLLKFRSYIRPPERAHRPARGSIQLNFDRLFNGLFNRVMQVLLDTPSTSKTPLKSLLKSLLKIN